MTRILRAVPVLLLLGWPGGAALAAQSSAGDVADEIMGHFQSSTNKVGALAAAVPEELYGWSPGEGVMTVAQVYAHITHYNFMYLRDNMGIAAPAGVHVDDIESIEDKAKILALFDQSVEHVRGAIGHLSPGDLAAPTRLYGRDVPKWAVMMQLVAHMNEHLGQSIAYARMNGIAPPWSR